jgi:hypothetical protein
MERISTPKKRVTIFWNPNRIIPPHNAKSISAYNSDWWLLWLLNAKPPRKNNNKVVTIDILVNNAVFAVYSYMCLYFSKKAHSGKKLTYKATINPKIPMYLANFPCSKTPENNAITAVRKTIIKTLII